MTYTVTTVTFTGATTLTLSNQAIWDTWTTTQATSTTNSIWTNWTVNANTTAQTQAQIAQQSNWPSPAPEELAAAKAKAMAEAARREEANQKALTLLESHLTPSQLATMQKHKWFLVKGGKTGKEYAIQTRGGSSGNIYQLGDKGQSTFRFCCHPDYHSAPMADHFLTQMLWLRFNEREFLKRANKSPYTGIEFKEAA